MCEENTQITGFLLLLFKFCVILGESPIRQSALRWNGI